MPMRPTTRLATVAAAAAALLLGSAAAASAQSDGVDDRRYDVLIQSTGDLASKGTYAQRVASSNADVDKITVNHGTGFVAVRVTMHKLTLNELGYTYGAIKLNAGDSVDAQYFIQPDGEGGIAGIVEGPTTQCQTGPDGGGVKGSSRTGVNGFIQLYIPRTCLDSPRSLRVGGFGYYSDLDGSSSSFSITRPGAAAEALAEPTNQNYIDPIDSRYINGREYTKTLARG